MIPSFRAERVRLLVIVSAVILFVSLALSWMICFADQPFVLIEFDLSDLQWYKGNPRGYLYATIGPMVAMVVMTPLVAFLYTKYRAAAPNTAFAGSAMFVVTIVTFVVNAILSTLSSDDWLMHGVLARSSFSFLIITNVIFLHAAHIAEKKGHLDKGLTTPVLLMLTHVSLFIILSIFIGPHLVGYNYPLMWIGLEPSHILGSCEVIYLILGYITLYRLV